jgi:hypothetical protein
MRASVMMSPDGFTPGPTRPIQPQGTPQNGPQPVPQPVTGLSDSGGPIITRKPPNDAPAAESAASKIRAFSQSMATAHASDGWSRKPFQNKTGAMHVKSFHCKLTGESLEFLDKQINDWLDAHPDFEIKMVTGTVGEWTGKLREPNLILQIWV